MPNCCCCTSAKFNGVLSFHGFPSQTDVRSEWIVNIRRDKYVITTHYKVCSRHFISDKMIEPTTLQGRKRLTKGAVPTLFEWNQYTVETPRRGVWERVDRFVEPAPPEDEVDLLFNDQDYCSVPEPAAMDMSASANEIVSNEVEELRKELQELRLQREFGLQRNTTLKREHRDHIRALDIQTHQVVLQEVGAVIELHPKRKLNKPFAQSGRD
uniref:THAP domain-containing protein 1 n=1 Tax=Gadus morhua TaxID=8049 RepID=A0A8C5AAH4_GADMO